MLCKYKKKLKYSTVPTYYFIGTYDVSTEISELTVRLNLDRYLISNKHLISIYNKSYKYV